MNAAGDAGADGVSPFRSSCAQMKRSMGLLRTAEDGRAGGSDGRAAGLKLHQSAFDATFESAATSLVGVAAPDSASVNMPAIASAARGKRSGNRMDGMRRVRRPF